MRDYKGDVPNGFYDGSNVAQSAASYLSPISSGFTASDLYLFVRFNTYGTLLPVWILRSV
ncbi:hypothetical protein K6121_06685 [Neisseria subflava]|uniref:hypothetical protein n=1 Tax=Neisseria subflava TaxID=28449 RepID=UPI001C996E07|nr:hypothetical protein [Neisseria subflava]MBY6286044.1 hypothetical protein [Neisseria subflava]